MAMKNRPPKPSNRIPVAIQSEYNTLMWYKRALEDLKELDSDRSRALISSIEPLISIPSVERQGTSDNKVLCLQSPTSSAPASDIGEVHWYNQFVLPECICNGITNLRVKEVLFGVTILILIILMIV